MPTDNVLTKRFEVKGTRYYKAKLAYERGDLVNNSPLRLAHQPNNKHDSNAVAIYLRKTGEMIGHVPREHAPLIRKLLELSRIESITAKHLQSSDDYLYLDCNIDIVSNLKQTSAWIKALTVQNVPGVYSITCTAIGYIYIGESEHIRNRIQEHLEQLNLLSHHNIPMQDCYNQHGNKDVWDFIILEVITEVENRKQRETEIIDEFMSNGKDLFNLTPDGKGRLKQKSSKATGSASYSDRRKLREWIDEIENENWEKSHSTFVTPAPHKTGCLSIMLYLALILMLLCK